MTAEGWSAKAEIQKALDAAHAAGVKEGREAERERLLGIVEHIWTGKGRASSELVLLWNEVRATAIRAEKGD